MRYGRPVIGWTEAKQRDLFAQHGVKSRDGAPIYFDTVGTFPRQRKAAIASLRAGAKDELGIAQRREVLAQCDGSVRRRFRERITCRKTALHVRKPDAERAVRVAPSALLTIR